MCVPGALFQLGSSDGDFGSFTDLPERVAIVDAFRIDRWEVSVARWRRAVERRTRIVQLFMPRDRTERLLWVLVAASAGFGEEITWRGVQPTLLATLLGHPVVAAALVAVTFGIGHMLQGWRSAAIIVVFATSFQTVVWLSGSLYVAMAVHFIYDVVAGMTYGRLGEELGYPIEGVTPPDARAPVPV